MTQPRWLTLAWADLGVAETPGPDHTARVVGYYGDVGHPNVTDDETAWCAAFLGSCGADVMTARACAASVVAVVNEALDVWARAGGDTAAAGRAALDAGLEVVAEAFSRLVGPGREETQDESRRNVAVIIPVGDPLRDEILAAVERGVSVTVDDSRVDP